MRARCCHGIAFAVLISTVSTGHASAQAGSEWLFAVGSNSGCCSQLHRLNAATSAVELTWNYNLAGIAARGLTWDTERLIAHSFLFPNRLVSYHPANAAITVLGTTGLNNNTSGHGVEWDPVSGHIYISTPYALYRSSPNSPTAIPVANFSGFKAPWDYVQVLGIDSLGQAFALGANDGQTRHAYYHMNLATAQLTWIADIIVPNGQGGFLDVAASATGDVWASFKTNGLTPNANGLYRIDPNTFGVTFVRYMPEPYMGLAFVPANVQATYCAAKASSIGCLPSISADGFPSPTASSGYTIRAAQVRNQTSGTLAFSVGARAALPFGGGTLCLTPPLRRTGAQNAGGASAPVADCSGAWQLDFNAWMAQNVALPAGTTVRVQWLGRDPGFAAPNNWSLSNALEFDLRP
jgi:hypothetical protein